MRLAQGLWESHWDSDAERDSDVDSEEDVTDAEADVRVMVESKRREEQGLQVCPDTIVAVEPSAKEDVDELMEAGVHAQETVDPWYLMSVMDVSTVIADNLEELTQAVQGCVPGIGDVLVCGQWYNEEDGARARPGAQEACA